MSLVDCGLLTSEHDVLREISKGRSTEEAGRASIAWIGIPTCNRGHILERTLTSHIQQARRWHHPISVVVSDDSPDSATRADNKSRLRTLAHSLSCRIVYAGLEEKCQFIAEMARLHDLPTDILEFALLRRNSRGGSFGANSNALLIHTVNDLLLSVDDDTLCRTAVPPTLQEGLSLTSVHDPAECWYYPEGVRQSDLDALGAVDFIGEHEKFLGRTVHSCVDQLRDVRDLHLDEIGEDFVEGLAVPGARVAMTSAGVIGDSGMNLPRYYLLLERGSHSRLVSSEAFYRKVLSSRQILRAVTRPTVGNQLFCAGGNLGFDNRYLLPPFMPQFRGQDDIYGVTLSLCCPSSYSCALPLALCHAPLEERAFDVEAFWEDPSAVYFSQVMTSLLLSMGPLPFGMPESERMISLGSYLFDIGSMPTHNFEKFAKKCLLYRRAQQFRALELLRQRNTEAPSYYTDDLQRYSKALRAALESSESVVPVELRQAYGSDFGLVILQRMTAKYGTLLEYWPHIVAAARDLSQRGIEIAKAV